MSARLETAVLAVSEPQHGYALVAFEEHGVEWVECKSCGRQWAIRGDIAEVVTEGDGLCDEGGES